MTQSSPLAELVAVDVEFAGHTALRAITCTIRAGDRVALLGASGAGKSTLLRVLNGVQPPTRGKVLIMGKGARDLSPRQRRQQQRSVASIAQGYDLIDHVRVIHNVNAGRLGHWSLARAFSELAWPRLLEPAMTALTQVGLEWAPYERTERLSGGERQRVAVARALVQKAELLLADEPVSSLDPALADRVLQLLIAASTPGALVISLHQPELAQKYCTRAIGLDGGAIAFDVPIAELSAGLLTELYGSRSGSR